MRAVKLLLFLGLGCCVGACEPPPAASCDDGPADGCPCDTDGTASCSIGGGQGYECCGGAWTHFQDGPCEPARDGAVPSCEDDPSTPGCPCDTEGEVRCPISDWRRVCEGGTWTEESGRVCC